MKKTRLEKKDILPGLARKMSTLEKILDIRRSKLAAGLGVKLDSYTRYTTNARTPGLEILATIATNHNISLDWLILGRGPTLYTNTTPSTPPPNLANLQPDPHE